MPSASRLARVAVAETSEPAPDTIYGRTKLESEEVALHEHPGTTVLRLAAVYGPRMRGNYPLLLKALGKGLPMMIGDGRNRRTLVHVEDVARAAMLVAERDDAIGKVYNVTDGGIHSFDDVARAMLDEQSFENKMLKAYIRDLEERMRAAAADLEFEEAARIREAGYKSDFDGRTLSALDPWNNEIRLTIG